MLVSRVIVFITLSMRKTKGEIKRGKERERDREKTDRQENYTNSISRNNNLPLLFIGTMKFCNCAILINRIHIRRCMTFLQYTRYYCRFIHSIIVIYNFSFIIYLYIRLFTYISNKK